MRHDSQQKTRLSRRAEVMALARLGLPVIMSRVGLYTMEVVDTLIVGQVGAPALAGVGTGGAIFWFVAVTASALLLPLDAMISRRLGSGHVKDSHNLLLHGLLIALALSAMGITLLGVVSANLSSFGIGAEMLGPAHTFLATILWSFPLVLATSLMNSFWQARKRPLPMALIIILANLLNYIANRAWVLGEFGFQALGVQGSALATIAARIFIVVAILAYSSLAYRFMLFQVFKDAWSPSWQLVKRILRQGIPAAAQAAAEVGAFSLSTIVVTRLGAQATAAHQILLRIASFTFMFPLGISQATSVMVGHHIGEGNDARARQAGWSGILLGGGIMAISTLIIIGFPGIIYGSFTNDPEVLRIGLGCLLCVGLFQTFDGIQVAATGALRGVGNTKASMYANLLGYYLLGLPLGLWLCFFRDMNVLGLWIGLATGLVAVSFWLVFVWYRWPIDHINGQQLASE